ncbi:hypothetical protein EJ03DRAFT_332341 [Teratosphaeria nubilosa]|uniref:Uncharacterized protein n=1 Tax=Teratosphaeria nubilosa TaxID=161662 RepID=A0A6G1KTK2_9PEZI|nr:hypothetical protein EJ03DRAFT_332341 [Teratosphaeria nubilosa]
MSKAHEKLFEDVNSRAYLTLLCVGAATADAQENNSGSPTHHSPKQHRSFAPNFSVPACSTSEDPLVTFRCHKTDTVRAKFGPASQESSPTVTSAVDVGGRNDILWR